MHSLGVHLKRSGSRVFQKAYLPFLEERVGLRLVSKDLGGTKEGDLPLISEANQHEFW